MKQFVVIILTLATFQVTAQDQIMGVIGGASWTNITSGKFDNQTKQRQGFSGGLTYEYFLNPGFSLGTDLIYNQRGFQLDMEIPNGQMASSEFNYDYISLPVKAGFYDRQNKFFSFLKAGLVPSLLINAKTVTPRFDDNAAIIGTEFFDVKNNVSKFDLGGLAEIGTGYRFIEKISLSASFIYQHSITSITNAEYFSDSKIKHNGMTLQLSLRWSIINEL
ncbi:porin family protein [Anditalea andensis]|uniref:Outer membrane protein beta-barrel domain-containing protein n=1 Tax=Anditalea andensis TaxID=1048983 RepID=A0A074KS63_9BACT|nr:porin family protein [Anditalea andensis]KEO71744.1 hypothetical protein EL17_21400 [Anditalea andensis]